MGSQLSWLEHTPDKREVDGPSPFEPTKVLFRTEYGLKRAKELDCCQVARRLTTAQQDKVFFFKKEKDEYKGKFHNLKVKLMVKKHKRKDDFKKAL